MLKKCIKRSSLLDSEASLNEKKEILCSFSVLLLFFIRDIKSWSRLSHNTRSRRRHYQKVESFEKRPTHFEQAQPIIKLEDPQIKMPRPRPTALMIGTVVKLPAGENSRRPFIRTTLGHRLGQKFHMTGKTTCGPDDSTDHCKRMELGRPHYHVSDHGNDPNGCTGHPLIKHTWGRHAQISTAMHLRCKMRNRGSHHLPALFF